MKFKSLIIACVLFIASNCYALNQVQLGPEYIPNPSIGRSLSLADIYVGEPDTDPEIVGNQKQISIQQENGSIVQVSQPITTGAGGVPLYNGSPVIILVEGNYSLKIVNSGGSQIYYTPSDLRVNENTLSFYGCDFDLAVSEIGATPTILLVDCQSTLTQDETTPRTLTLDKTSAGGFTGAYTLRINGGIIGDMTSQWFDSSVTVKFGATGSGAKSRIDKLWVEMWGAEGDIDSTTSIQAAIDATFNTGIPLHAGQGIFLISASLTAPDDVGDSRPWNTFRFFGSGSHSETAYVSGGFVYGTTLEADTGFDEDIFELVSTRHIEIADMLLIGTGKGTSGSYGAHINQANVDITFRNVKFVYFEYGVRIGTITQASPANDDSILFDHCWFDHMTTGIRSEGQEAFLIRVDESTFYNDMDYGLHSVRSGSGTSSTNFIVDGGLFITDIAHITTEHNGRGSLNVTGSHFEGTGKILNADTGTTALLLPAINFIGCNFNGGFDLTAPAIIIRGNGAANFIGNTWESVKPLIQVEGSSPAGQAVFQGNRWFGNPTFRKVSDNTYADVVEIGERHLYFAGDSTQVSRDPVISLKINGKRIDYDDLITIGRDTREIGDLSIDPTPAVNVPVMNITTVAGTAGTLNSGNTTGSITNGTAALTVNSTTELYIGCHVTIAGVTGTFKILDINSLIATLDGNADATVAGAAVAYSAYTNKWLDSASGTFTADGDSSTTISNTYINSTSSRVVIFPTNAAAANLQRGTSAFYISAKVADTSFTVTTADAGNAAGTETFDYIIGN